MITDYKLTQKISLCFLSLLFSNACLAELKNLDYIKQDLIQYHDSGKYKADQQKVINQAILYLQTRLKQPHTEKLAIVLDIDETSLSNFPDMVKFSFGGTLQQDDDAEGAGHDPVIFPTLELYRYAKKNNVAVFFVTGRKEHYREGTVRNLKSVGYQNWDGLILEAENYKNASAAPYKIEARKKIESLKYDIVLNVGDQDSDLIGGYADKVFKMPNPFYIVP